jgi:capsular polysaccharide biosynthesis protein
MIEVLAAFALGLIVGIAICRFPEILDGLEGKE